jgi:hypothetical protein
MSDRELLELAAKGAGLQVVGNAGEMVIFAGHFAGGFVIRNDRGGDSLWNPLTDDGDALRLSARLYINIEDAVYDHYPLNLPDYPERLPVIRRSIVQAAANIGRRMP